MEAVSKHESVGHADAVGLHRVAGAVIEAADVRVVEVGDLKKKEKEVGVERKRNERRRKDGGDAFFSIERECKIALTFCFILAPKTSFLRAETLERSSLRDSSEDKDRRRRNAAAGPRQRPGKINRSECVLGHSLSLLLFNALDSPFSSCP